jgi:hypothetical protein
MRGSRSTVAVRRMHGDPTREIRVKGTRRQSQCFAHWHLALPAKGGNSMKKGELRATISRGYREMSELTKMKCGGDKCPGMGNKAYRCCDQLHCQMTIDHAYKDWGIRLPPTGHQFPLMGPTGCTALPHLRPWCTLHQCQIQATGSTKDRKWDAKYFSLRNRLTRLEQQLAEM